MHNNHASGTQKYYNSKQTYNNNLSLGLVTSYDHCLETVWAYSQMKR